MLNAKKFANAVTTVWLISYLLCALFAIFLPDVFFSVAGSWFHAINIEAVRAPDKMSILTFVQGVISFGIYVWVLTFAAISLYNRFNKVKAA